MNESRLEGKLGELHRQTHGDVQVQKTPGARCDRHPCVFKLLKRVQIPGTGRQATAGKGMGQTAVKGAQKKKKEANERKIVYRSLGGVHQVPEGAGG